jgi:hypothetical protein
MDCTANQDLDYEETHELACDDVISKLHKK